MRNTTLFFCLLLISFTGMAQPLNVAENFNDNSLFWEVGSNDLYDCKIENGFYTIDHHPANKTGRFYWKDFIIDDSNDFIIEIKMRYISGVIDNGYGLFWGSDSWKNGNRAIVSGNQYYKIYHYEGENVVNDVSWTKDTAIVKPAGEFNVIRLHKEGAFINVTINEAKVARVRYRVFMGNKIGFYISEPMKVEVDYLHIYQHGDAKINLVKNPINGFVKENLGENVNGKFSDRMPVISSDGKTLYYIKGDYPHLSGLGSEIYYSEQSENGKWSEAKSIGSPINNSGHNAMVSVSADGNSLMLMNTYNADGSPKGPGLSSTQKTDNGWEIPKEIKIEDYYNDSQYAEYCLSSNKKVLLMTAQRKDSYGSKDLYVSFKRDSTFSAPINMGAVINTSQSETSPFLAPDDKTLYFSTSGHPGYGSNDVFVTRRLDETWTNWSKPENLGPEINSADWDAYFTVTAKGDLAYLVSSDNSFGSEDIFKIKIPDAAKPNPVTLIKGKVLNAKTKAPVFAEIIYQNLNTNEEVGRALSDPQTGDYQIVLPSGVMYGFLAEKLNFYPVSNAVDATILKEYNEIQYDLLLSPIEVGENIRLNNLFFESNKSELQNTSISELNRLVDFLKTNPRIVIEISGHTDNVGAAAYNQTLSEQRAKSVVTYLISKDIETKRLTSKGFGLTKPVADNSTDEGKAMNRRVEMKILEK